MSPVQLKALLLDMDGVLWRGSHSIGSLPAIFAKIQSRGLKMAFVTNNATRTVAQYLQTFRGFGLEVAAEQVHTSAKVTAEVLKAQHPAGGNVYVIGELGLQEALHEQGFHLADEDCLAVVVGLDRHMTYEKLKRATHLIRGGAAFIGTNPDRTLPSPEGEVPGAGSILAALEAATEVRATVIGKPEPALLVSALKQLGLLARQALMAGDRVETDVAAGQKAGCRTALLLSGVTSEAVARAWRPPPDYIERDLESLLDKI
ncbi:MAG TPA: HAD-IIA family hydrolase [Anaerolineales bacterium]|nr:HAD-IIA family hydrolase [Anaerolineales bacterium]